MNEFKELPDYEGGYERAVEVVSALQRTDIIPDLRNVPDTVYEIYEDELLTGPPGQTYLVTETAFPSVYASYLQSYELAIIAEATPRWNPDPIFMTGIFRPFLRGR